MPVNISMSDFINGNFPVGTYYGFTRRQDGRIDLLTEGGGGGGGNLPDVPLDDSFFVLDTETSGSDHPQWTNASNAMQIPLLPTEEGNYNLSFNESGGYTWVPAE